MIRLNLSTCIWGCLSNFFIQKDFLKNLTLYIIGGIIPVLILILIYVPINNGVEIIYNSLFMNFLAAAEKSFSMEF